MEIHSAVSIVILGVPPLYCTVSGENSNVGVRVGGEVGGCVGDCRD